LPFDIAGQRMQRYTLKDGRLDPESLRSERDSVAEAIKATLADWRERRASPVYAQLPNLIESDWKTLKVGDVNEFWEALNRWQKRIEIARLKNLPGDIMVLAQETPNRLLDLEALRIAADALIRLKRPFYALNVLEQARRLDPHDLRCQQLEGLALGRAGRFAEAHASLENLTRQHRDGESLGLLARTWKDEWRQLLENHTDYQTDTLKAARDTESILQSAAEAYRDAFSADPADYFPGINALTLGRLWEHVTGSTSKLDLASVAGGVRWAVDCALARRKDYWALSTRAELALAQDDQAISLAGFSEAATLARHNGDLFGLDSTRQQLELMGRLDFRKNIVEEAAEIIDRAEKDVGRLAGMEAQEPALVVLFSGHMIDNPSVRGRGKAKPARFPASKADAAGARIRVELDKIGASPGDLGICGGACGGDLLFAEACLDRGMRLQVYLAKKENQFLRESVTFADPDHYWERLFREVTSKNSVKVRSMPEELGPTPEGVEDHDRCNRWMLYSALSCGLKKVSFLTLWDGRSGDGPGGTETMAELVRQTTGREPLIIDPATLDGFRSGQGG
jgi:tetratricopeptide (TPR) repeat protein